MIDALIDAHTQQLWMIGHPVTQTQSPGVFNRALRAEQQDKSAAFIMTALDVPPPHLGTALTLLRHSSSVIGALLTVPHKLPACRYLDVLSTRSQALGIVNVIKKNAHSQQLYGDALDGHGFCNALRQEGAQLQGLKIMIIGCGGAGGASAWDALAAGAAKVGLFDIQVQRANALAQALTKQFGYGCADCVQPHENTCTWDCILNASPAGMSILDPLPMAIEGLSKQTILVDATTGTQDSRWLQLARKAGHRTIDGRTFAVAQAASIAHYFNLPNNVIDHLRVW